MEHPPAEEAAPHAPAAVKKAEPEYVPHLGQSRTYVRDFVLGVNDGLVSTFLLVAGIVGGGLNSHSVLLAALAGALAGAISMALGELMATRSQGEAMEGELEVERGHLRHFRAREEAEVRGWFGGLGLSGAVLDAATAQCCASDESMLRAMRVFEFGMVDSAERRETVAMTVSGLAFVAGSLPAWLPFAFTDSAYGALLASLVLCLASLAAVGAGKTLVTRGNPWRGAAENAAVGAVGAAVSFGLGLAYEALSS